MMKSCSLFCFLLFLQSCNQGWYKPSDPAPAGANYEPVEAGDSSWVECSYGPRLIEIIMDGNRPSERYHPTDTVLTFERIYVNGGLDSVTEWSDYGLLWFQTKYENGLRHGRHIAYGDDGKSIRYIQIYEHDVLVNEEEPSN